MKETIKTTLLGATIGGFSSVTLVAIVFLLVTSEEPFQQLPLERQVTRPI